MKKMETNSGLALLAGQIIQFGIKNIPPGTLMLIAGQTALFVDPGFLPPPEDVCISSYHILYLRDWLRLLLSAFYHGSDMHLYYNMLSLLYKGSWLEKKFGSLYYMYLIGVFTTLTSAVYVLLGLFLSWLLGNENYLRACAVGFSGVLFSMKVLTTHYAPSGPQYLLGMIPIPSKHIYWAELVLIQLMVPNASFVGHLAGILVGLAYTWGPLKYLMELLILPEGSSVDPPTGRTSPRQQSSSGPTTVQQQSRNPGQDSAGVAYRSAQPSRQQLESNTGTYQQRRQPPDFGQDSAHVFFRSMQSSRQFSTGRNSSSHNGFPHRRVRAPHNGFPHRRVRAPVVGGQCFISG